MSPALRALCLALCAFAPATALAEEESSAQLRERARDIRDTAEARFLTTTYHCYDKFFVNACLDEAKTERIEQVKIARALEAKANRMDRAERVKAMEARLGRTNPGDVPAPDSATDARP